MLIVHLMFGVLFGALAAVAGAVMGLSFWGAAGCYVLGANVGLLAGLPSVLLRRPAKARQLTSA